MRSYKVLLPIQVDTADGSYKQGDEFEAEYTDAEEFANLSSGLLEVVPQTYKVVGTSKVHDTAPGDTFTAALPVGQERLLVEGGHIALEEPAAKKPARKTSKGGEE